MSITLPPGITPLGDLSRPVPAGTAFASIPPEKAAGPEAMKPGPDDNWTLGPDGRLTATALGLVEPTDQGLRVRPLWTVSADKMTLSVDLHPLDFAGQAITAQQVALAIVGRHGQVSMDTAALATAQARVQQSGTPEPGCVVSRGTPAVPGQNGRLATVFKRRKSAGLLREDGSMDFKERGKIEQVEAGAVIARLHPPTTATPGVDVFGARVDAPDGRLLAVKAGDNVQERRLEDGAVEYLAAISGAPELSQATLRVSEVLLVASDVDLESGNIISEKGSVEIRGSLRSGFTVTAGLDVLVKDAVESADINAGKDVTVQGGILMGGKNTVRAGGNVSAKFIHNAMIRAGGDVLSRSDIIQSDIEARGMVSANNGNGSVVGGVIRCRTGLLAKEIGGETGVTTLIEVFVEGPRTPELSARKEELDKTLAKLARGIGSEDALAVLMKSPEEDRRILAELIKIKSQALTALKAVEQELAEDLLAGELDLAEVSIKATGAVHPGTEIRMGRRTLSINAPMPAAEFRWNPGRREIETA